MSMALALLIIRLVLGFTMMAHGAQKLFGWFGGYGPKGTGGWMESLGIKPGVLMAVLAGLAEFGGGLLVAAGLFTPIGAALLILTMIVAIASVHAKNGFWSTAGGYEYNLLLIAVSVGLILSGAGAYSLDALL
ncbi:DoxX family protein [Paenibacillus timonensis]|uniref:DoxX family protein n=1 Tax=Paenibacillus timonensis TaxID=225915 RepID=A0ABW3SF38_9BACL|nr:MULTISPECIES: DoxX family protein [Paenibacillus]MCH1642014.1 DoxX family protein [Paenibacillus timonensis]MDU2239264.1 DoxX family protein [Paenibacillus sp.]GJM82049.1 oxidoreductase [Paenibacillus sp. HMSSN-139]